MNRLNLVKNFKAYTLRMKDRRKQNLQIFKAYLKQQRIVIIKNTQRKMIRGTLWVGFLSLSYYFAHKIYSQKLQVKQMSKKLTKLYPSIVTKVSTQQGQRQVYYVHPQYDDQLANIVQMCWKYHYKIIVKSDIIQKENLQKEIQNFIKDIPQNVTEKCLIINLSKLKSFQIDQINGFVKVQSGITCKQINEKLIQRGYEAIFHDQIAINLNQTVYDAVSNNYPTKNSSISQIIVNLDLISPQGQYFRSSNQNNQYGATPNLNNIFVGTQGIFGIPIRTKFKIIPLNKQKQKNKKFEISCIDLNQKLLISRKINEFKRKYQNLLNFTLQNNQDNKIILNVQTHQLKYNIFKQFLQQIKNQIVYLNQINQIKDGRLNNFNIFFNSNQMGFQKFLILKDKYLDQNLEYQYSNNLLKVKCQKQQIMIQLISQLSLQNSVVIWTKQKKFLKSIKKTIDESQVGSQLMKILVQIRQGIDHKKIYYSHNRYQQYFAKGTFRKLTQIFW